tara:strand:+ start:551 stop:787 length:237 start_codon:yes stop_codon:yes gene_type:complete
MKLFNKINWNVFLVSVSVGLFFCYILTPKPKIVFKFPTPENAGSVIYVDNVNNCYKYKATEVECPKDDIQISKQNLDI